LVLEEPVGTEFIALPWRRSMGKILIVDDDVGMRLITARILEGEGYEVLIAEDGHAGLKLFVEHEPDLVITDLFMPGKDGLETILEIKALGRNVGILATSGGGATGRLNFLEIATDFGADRVLSKPFRSKELLAAVEEMLAKVW
jgi:CheY-like chemotaxis protein